MCFHELYFDGIGWCAFGSTADVSVVHTIYSGTVYDTLFVSTGYLLSADNSTARMLPPLLGVSPNAFALVLGCVAIGRGAITCQVEFLFFFITCTIDLSTLDWSFSTIYAA